MKMALPGARVDVLPDADSLASAAADLILALAVRAVEERGRFTVALAGGSTPVPVYRALASSPRALSMPWRNVEVFWGDERCVDVTDARSNERMAREALLDHVPVPAENVHPMGCGGEAVAQSAAADYEALLRSTLPDGVIDLVLLGLGDDAHTASLFAGDPALVEQERWVIAAKDCRDTGTVDGESGERLWRVTLTAPFINRARLVLFVVSGAAKATAVDRVLRGDGDPLDAPALLIRPAPGRLRWLLDEAAAPR